MRHVVVEGIDANSVLEVVGARTYTEGLAAVQERKVAHMEWDEVALALHALVRDGDGRPYDTVAYFEPWRGGVASSA